jgi:DHA2 family multidrug resistance protein
MTETAIALETKTSHRGMLTFSLMVATVMQVLDTTIANVALPHMQGSLGATQDQITWVLTCYILSSAITMPLTNVLCNRWGQKRIFLISVFGFTISSMLCGIADSLNSMVVYRFLQGIFGASFIPLSQTILLDIYPKEKHGSALALWGMGIMIGPILGPILGGYLTDTYDWRWVFYINVPVGVVAFIGLYFFLKESPIQKNKPFDIKGFILLALFLSFLQIFLDRGEQLDWFESLEIRTEAIICCLSFYFFIAHSSTTNTPFFSLKLFKDRNFLISLMLGLGLGVILQSTLALTPSLLQDLMNYPVLTAGLVTAPRGVGTLAAMMVAGKLIGKVDAKIWLSLGLSMTAYSLYMTTNCSPLMDYWLIINSGLLLGFGLGVLFVSLTALAFSTLSATLRPEATGLYNLTRNIGGSIGISIMESFLARSSQRNHAYLTEFVTPYNKRLTSTSLSPGLDINQPTGLAQWDLEITQQGTYIAYLNSFKLLMFTALFLLVIVGFIRNKGPKAEKPSEIGEI